MWIAKSSHLSAVPELLHSLALYLLFVTSVFVSPLPSYSLALTCLFTALVKQKENHTGVRLEALALDKTAQSISVISRIISFT